MTARARYPSDAAIKRAVKLARELGLKVSAIEIGPDGAIRTIDSEPPRVSAADAWLEQLEHGEERQ